MPWREVLKSRSLMIQGTTSGAGKSLIVTALCRILSNRGYTVAPFKSQNMSSLSYKIIESDKVIARAQAIQAIACRLKPTPDMNPILLKPVGNYESEVYVKGEYFAKMSAQEYYSKFVIREGFQIAVDSFKTLQRENEIILLEGAGSPAEINIQKYDIANMLIANKVKTPVILASDIERGGCFASILGTIMLLKPKHQKLVKGIIINKFRGDSKILFPAIKVIEEKIKKPVLGIVPKIDHNIPDEDSLDSNKEKNSIILKKRKYMMDEKQRQLSKVSQKGQKEASHVHLKRNEKTISHAKRNESDASNAKDEFFTNQQDLEKEIEQFSKVLESSIDFEYILKKIIK